MSRAAEQANGFRVRMCLQDSEECRLCRAIQATFCMVCEGKVGTKMFQFILSRTFGPELDLRFGNRSPAWTGRVVRGEKDIFGGGLIEHSKDRRIFEYSAKHSESQTIVSDRNGTTPNTCDKRQAQEESSERDASEINRYHI